MFHTNVSSSLQPSAVLLTDLPHLKGQIFFVVVVNNRNINLGKLLSQLNPCLCSLPFGWEGWETCVISWSMAS